MTRTLLVILSMPIKRPQLVNGEIYHIVIRAIEGFKLFRDEKDYLRMIHDLFEFNDDDSVPSAFRNQLIKTRSVLAILTERKKRKMLVEILAFCLMPNHLHLLVRQVREGGISKFMRKIGAGYGLYYNQKYKRRGRLFDGRYRIVHIKTEDQLKTVFIYIHTNPVALIVPEWKGEGVDVKELQKILTFLENYRWSSYPDYLAKKNFPSLTNREFLFEMMGGTDGCHEFVKAWLQFKTKLKEILKEIAIE